MSYYEYKYALEPGQEKLAVALMDSLYSGSDPYPVGSVHSMYFDTAHAKYFSDCLEGNARKTKLRVRWYNHEGRYQAQMKEKNLYRVDKLKYNFESYGMNSILDTNVFWHNLFNPDNIDPQATQLRYRGMQDGPLWPIAKISYLRRRYRHFDYRLNIDSNIVIELNPNHPGGLSGSTQIPISVVEIKTKQDRPLLPFLGILKLPQISFSKYALGLHLLSHDGDALNKYAVHDLQL